MDDVRMLRFTSYPAGPGPYDRWEVAVEATGQVIGAGDYPLDMAAVESVWKGYHAKLDQAEWPLVDRLRLLDRRTANPPYWTTGICGEAADEIERLRKALRSIDEMRAAVTGKSQTEMAYEMRSIAKAALA